LANCLSMDHPVGLGLYGPTSLTICVYSRRILTAVTSSQYCKHGCTHEKELGGCLELSGVRQISLAVLHILHLKNYMYNVPQNYYLKKLENSCKMQICNFLSYRNYCKTSCGAKAQQTPSPRCASRHRAVSRN